MANIPLIDIKAGNVPTTQDPALFNDLLEVYQALQILQRELSQVTRVSCIFDVDVTAGQPINIFNSGGILHGRLTNALDSTKPCYGYAVTAVAAGKSGEVRSFGICNTLTGLTPGTIYYIATSSGVLTTSRPAAAGNIIQAVGWALDTNQLLYNPSTLFIQL